MSKSKASAGDGGPQWLVIIGGVAALLASVATIVGVLISTGAIPNPIGGSTGRSFAGAWQSTDVGDGSHQTLTITDDLQVTYNDDRAGTCGSGRPATASGTGSISGTQLTVVLTVFCLQPREAHGSATYTFTYNASRDTLSDSFGNLWTRQG